LSGLSALKMRRVWTGDCLFLTCCGHGEMKRGIRMTTNEYGIDPYDMPVIGIDFDGTIVFDAYPKIGDPIPGAIETINKWFNAGFWIVIHSCRAKEYEFNLVEWLDEHEVLYHTVNENLSWRIQKYGGDTRKMSLDINIDDKNISMLGESINEASWVSFDLWIDYIMEHRNDNK